MLFININNKSLKNLKRLKQYYVISWWTTLHEFYCPVKFFVLKFLKNRQWPTILRNIKQNTIRKQTFVEIMIRIKKQFWQSLILIFSLYFKVVVRPTDFTHYLQRTLYAMDEMNTEKSLRRSIYLILTTREYNYRL